MKCLKSLSRWYAKSSYLRFWEFLSEHLNAGEVNNLGLHIIHSWLEEQSDMTWLTSNLGWPKGG